MTQATPKRGRPKVAGLRERRREQILDAAARIFATTGYRNTDLQQVADVLGVGKGTIYRYFPSKEELFLAAVDRGMRRLYAAVHACTDVVADPLERVGCGIRAYLAFFRDHPQLAELLIQERAEFRDREQQTYFAYRQAGIGEWRELWRGLIAQGRVRDVPVERITDVLCDLVYGTMFTNYFAGRHKSLEDQVHEILDIVFFGVLSETERQKTFSREPQAKARTD
jgi:AcrR family transcriptional regulator